MRRRIFMALADGEKSRRYIAEQKKKLHLGVPGHGIAVAVPIKAWEEAKQWLI